MPFFAKDWRSPGEAWVKTDDGWEKLKILECRRQLINSKPLLKEPVSPVENYGTLDNEKENKHNDGVVAQPYCQITIKCTKEIAGFNGLSDALNRLDFHNAVQDYRRFPYIAKLLDLLLSHQRITTLPGCAQKFLLNLLEEIALQAQASGQNVHVLQSLLIDLRGIVRGDLWWGQPVGSSQLWGKHVRTLDRIDLIAASIPVDNQDSPQGVQGDVFTFEDLPEECVRQILFRLADHRDLVSVAEAYAVAQQLSHEQSVWRRLCTYHFSRHQIDFVFQQIKKEDEKKCVSRSCCPATHRGTHPYRERSRRSPAKENINEAEEDAERQERGKVPVSSAFHEHINKNREFVASLQRVDFQDVRNYLDQRAPLVSAGKNRNTSNKRKAREVNEEATDWEYIYHRLRRQFGLREEYADSLYLCRQCRCLFWKSLGHPCVMERCEKSSKQSVYVPVPPEAFLKFFSL